MRTCNFEKRSKIQIKGKHTIFKDYYYELPLCFGVTIYANIKLICSVINKEHLMILRINFIFIKSFGGKLRINKLCPFNQHHILLQDELFYLNDFTRFHKKLYVSTV